MIIRIVNRKGSKRNPVVMKISVMTDGNLGENTDVSTCFFTLVLEGSAVLYSVI
jgi:hypothetical protein